MSKKEFVIVIGDKGVFVEVYMNNKHIQTYRGFKNYEEAKEFVIFAKKFSEIKFDTRRAIELMSEKEESSEEKTQSKKDEIYKKRLKSMTKDNPELSEFADYLLDKGLSYSSVYTICSLVRCYILREGIDLSSMSSKTKQTIEYAKRYWERFKLLRENKGWDLKKDLMEQRRIIENTLR